MKNSIKIISAALLAMSLAACNQADTAMHEMGEKASKDMDEMGAKMGAEEQKAADSMHDTNDAMKSEAENLKAKAKDMEKDLSGDND